MERSDRNFWSPVKEISGLDSSKSNAAPSCEEIANHFAKKMTSGKDDTDIGFVPREDSKVPFCNIKIRFKDVLKSFKRLDPNKSANGPGPRFLKSCADVLASSVYRLFRFIVKSSEYPAN